MFSYFQNCEDPQKISYEDYLQNAVVPVVAVVSSPEMPIPENTGAVSSVLVQFAEGLGFAVH